MNKTIRFLAVVLAISVCVALADDDNDNDNDDDKSKNKDRDNDDDDDDRDKKGTGSGKRPDRDIRFDDDPTKDDDRELKFTAYSKNNNVSTRFRFELKLDGFPRFRVNFYRNNGSTTAGFSFRVGLRTLVEFVDNGTAQGLDPNDTVVSRFSLVGKKESWSYWNKTAEVTNSTTNITTRRFCIQRTNGSAVFYFCVRITDGVTKDTDRVRLDPNRIKLDIGFKNYPYVANDTKLALVAFVQSRSTANRDSASDTIAIGGDGQLSWVSNFTNKGTVYPILPSPFFDLSVLTKGDLNPGSDDDDDDDKEVVKALAFTFNTNRLNDTLWDPEIGLTDSAVLSSAFTLIVSPLVLVLCALMQVFLF